MTVREQGAGKRLRKLRKVRGLTRHHIAEGTRCPMSLVKKVEQGSVPPSAAFVAAAAQVLGVRPADLYGVDEREIAEKPPPGLDDIRWLRSALDAYDDPEPVGEPLDLAGALRRLEGIGRQLVGLRYAKAADELPPLLHHVYLLAERPRSCR